MENIIKLNNIDISDIIAEHFGVSRNNVKVYTEQESVGHGIGEHMEPLVLATVNREKATLMSDIPIRDKHTVGLIMRPVCECGYIFNELYYNDREKLFAPHVCPKCKRFIEAFSYCDPSKRTPDSDGNICLFE